MFVSTRETFHVKPLPHKKDPRYHCVVTLRRGAILTLALLLLPLLSSCVSVLNPTGWSPVTFDGDTAYLTASKGRISALHSTEIPPPPMGFSRPVPYAYKKLKPRHSARPH